MNRRQELSKVSRFVCFKKLTLSNRRGKATTKADAEGKCVQQALLAKSSISLNLVTSVPESYAYNLDKLICDILKDTHPASALTQQDLAVPSHHQSHGTQSKLC